MSVWGPKVVGFGVGSLAKSTGKGLAKPQPLTDHPKLLLEGQQ